MSEPATRMVPGRGATINPTGRYEKLQQQAFDDGWNLPGSPNAPRTTAYSEYVKNFLTRNQSPDIPFDRSINPYRGCDHGCVYCYARPTHAYMGLSPGLDFETKLFVKENGPERLEQELRHKRYRPQTIALGANTDPYQPIEHRCGITRRTLEILLRHRHPVGIITKSASIERDLDILAEMARLELVQVSISVTSLDSDLSNRMEPRAAAPSRRLSTIDALSRAGVPVTVLVAPVIPGLNDRELEQILEATYRRGARRAHYILLRLPQEVKAIFIDWLQAHYPERAARVLHLMRSTREGRLYDSRPGLRMRGTGTYADLLARRFQVISRRLGFHTQAPRLNFTQFRHRPEDFQLRLFST
ncbi:MAG: PA0069 family radical SAM protein [Leptospiraceae bacterium]|nr:PA0069 family radical SAM protein [Leptospiraceae bacterium]